MGRKFKTVDYEKALDIQISLRECLPENHLARFIVWVIAQLDLGLIYMQYGNYGQPPYAPEILLALLFYGYATGVFSSRKIEKATYESIPFRFIAGGLHPDHDTIANFRKTFLNEIKELFIQILLVAQSMGIFKLGNISIDGTKIHADASKSKAVSYKHLLELEQKLRTEVEELLALAETDQKIPEGMVVEDEIILRQGKLDKLAEAKKVLEARAQARYETEMIEYEAKMREREAKERQTGRKPGGRPPKAPTPSARDKDQYNFTDPDSNIMKNSNNKGFEQDYNAQIAVEQDNMLIVGNTLSNHPNDKQEAVPTLNSIPTEHIGQPPAAAMDNGYYSEYNINKYFDRGIEPYIATGREPHNKSWQDYFAQQPDPPPEDATAKEKMAYKLRTEIGRAIYGLRKCTVEPVIGIIKEIIGFRQFSLRGSDAASGEWGLVCIGYNLKRMHTLKYA